MTTHDGANSGAQDVVLRLNSITKRFGALTANDSIDFDLKRGEVVALLGENGAGKTTLMNILFGHYTADEGHVELFGAPLPPGNPRAALDAGVGMVHQHFTLADNLTVFDNIVLGTQSLWQMRSDRAAARARIVQLAQDFGLSVVPEHRVGALSVGERQRVEILKALYRDAKILILDEPTAVLTPQETDALFVTLREMVARGLSVVFISHKLHEVMAIANRVVVLRHGKVAGQVATADTDRHKLAEMMVGAEVEPPKLREAAPGEPALTLSEATTPDRGNAPGLKAANLVLRAGQIIGLAGVSGNGQAALAGVLAGTESLTGGTLDIHGTQPKRWTPRAAMQAGIARIPEDRHAMGSIADFTLTENAILENFDSPPFAKRGWMNWRRARAFTHEVITRYDVRCPGPDTAIRQLSGGNMQKLILGRALEHHPQVILANQPVRGLDIGAITFVHNQLLAARDRGAAVMLISEDLDEVMALSDVIHVIYEGHLSPPFARGELSATELGVWMAGSGDMMAEEGGHAA